MNMKRSKQPQPPRRKRAPAGNGHATAAPRALPRGVPLSVSGRPEGVPGRVDITGIMAEGIRIDPDLTEGHPGYQESGYSEIIPANRLARRKTAHAARARAARGARRPPTPAVHVEMHDDHRHWLSDYAMWRDDLVIWQREINEALAGVKQLEDALRAHRDALQAHVKLTGAAEKAMRAHEHLLAEHERGGLWEDLLPMAKDHKKSADSHAKQRTAHERLKRQHHMVMAHWSLLFKSLGRMRL